MKNFQGDFSNNIFNAKSLRIFSFQKRVSTPWVLLEYHSDLSNGTNKEGRNEQGDGGKSDERGSWLDEEDVQKCLQGKP